MAVNIGTVDTFEGVVPDKAQAVKVLEEAAEVFAAWQGCDVDCDMRTRRMRLDHLMAECADLIQATCNLLAAYGVDDMTEEMEECRSHNERRGRLYA